MKKILLTVLFAAAIGFTYADKDSDVSKAKETPTPMIELNGQVLDINSDEVLVGVEIRIEGTDLKTYTDFDGNFSFQNIKPGKYNLTTSYISYKGSLIENFSADKENNELSIKLEEAN